MLALNTVVVGNGRAQETVAEPQLVRVYSHQDLYGVRNAAFRGDTLVVVANPEPAVFLFAPGGYLKTWGNRGEGPAELTNPGDVFWIDGDVLVWDYALLKLATYDTNGVLKETRRFEGVNAWRLSISAGDTLITLTPHGGGSNRVVRQAGSDQHTLVTLPGAARTVTLRAEGAPSLTRPAPFSPLSKFTPHSTGGIVVWNGQAPYLELLDRDGQLVAHLPLPVDRYRVTNSEREAWVDSTIPSRDIAGRGDIFRALRGVAKDQVTFPDWHPLVYGLIGDPDGGVWVQRTPSMSGAVWTYVNERGPQVTVRFPAGRRLLTIGSYEMAVRARDDMDVEFLEIYRRP